MKDDSRDTDKAAIRINHLVEVCDDNQAVIKDSAYEPFDYCVAISQEELAAYVADIERSCSGGKVIPKHLN